MGKRKGRKKKEEPLRVRITPEKPPKFIGEINTSFQVGVVYKGKNEDLAEDVFDMQFVNPANNSVCLLQNLLESSVREVAKSIDGYIIGALKLAKGGSID